MNREHVTQFSLDLSNEVVWINVGQRIAELPAVKVGGLKKILPSGPVQTRIIRAGPFGRISFKPPTLTACNFDAS